MAAPEPELFEFREDDPAPVLPHMAELAEAHRGWINLQPGVREEDATQVSSSLFGIFSGRGPQVPVCTWTPGEARRRGNVEPPSVGIEHGSGPKAANRLAGVGLRLPAGWRVLQDHPKRGLVVAVRAEARHEVVLGWLLAAGRELSTIQPTGSWLATVHRR